MSKMRTTSKEAYDNDVEANLGRKQLEVFSAIKRSKRPVCNQEIAIFLEIPINTVTPRTNELVEMGKVEKAFIGVYPISNRRVVYWKIADGAEMEAVTVTRTPSKPKYEMYTDENGEKVMREVS